MAGQLTLPVPALRRPLPPLRQVFRLGAPGDIWHKPAVSAVVALAALNFVLLGAGRLDLSLYTSAGALVALYGHGLPYPARTRTLAAVALGTVASTAAALTASALTGSVTVLVAVAASLAAVHKVVCDATRIGPPGSIIITFTSASCAFVPQRLGDLPFHLALTAGGAALAWLVCLAPALIRPHGPERIAVARALEAAARLLRSEPAGRPHAQAALAAAVGAGRQALAPRAPGREPRTARRENTAALHALLLRGESALAATAADDGRADRYESWARGLRRGRPLPSPEPLTPAEAHELREAAARPAVAPVGGPRRALRRALRQALRPGSPLLPIGLRVAVGCAAAGWLSMAFGVGRPYWAVVTAASVFQANSALSWQRALQRVLGNLLGLVLFTALLPVSHSGQLALVLLGLLCQFGAEATIARSYWLASVLVTPMALVMTEFAGYHPAREMVADRWLDTCIGALAGLAACLLVTNRRTATRLEHALTGVDDAAAAAHAAAGATPMTATPTTTTPTTGTRTGGTATTTTPTTTPTTTTTPTPATTAARAEEATAEAVVAEGATAGAVAAARGRLAHTLVELREAADTAAGEWWQPVLPHERVAETEQRGHLLLAALLRGRAAPSRGTAAL